MNLSQLKGRPGANKRIKRRGRGHRSGHGKTSCRGHKGAKARSGSTTHIGFEGGQMPLIRRVPKRGFANEDKIIYEITNIQNLNIFKNDTVIDAAALIDKGIIRNKRRPVKILGKGKLTKPLVIKANAFSKSAVKAIEAAGGKAEIVPVIH
jgi:large subunit ribosomal protein L15